MPLYTSDAGSADACADARKANTEAYAEADTQTNTGSADARTADTRTADAGTADACAASQVHIRMPWRRRDMCWFRTYGWMEQPQR
jgi:hypothetical protein